MELNTKLTYKGEYDLYASLAWTKDPEINDMYLIRHDYTYYYCTGLKEDGYGKWEPLKLKSPNEGYEGYIPTGLDLEILYMAYTQRAGRIREFMQDNEDILEENESLRDELDKTEKFYSAQTTYIDLEECRRIDEKENKKK